MARIRSIHPGSATDADLVSCSDSAQLFYYLLLTDCDDQGVFEWKPLELKMKLRPASSEGVDGYLAELAHVNKIRRFDVDGRPFGAVRNFRKWQRPKKPNSVHPLPPEFRTYVGLSASSSPPEKVNPPPVPPKAEIPPQMEDGGGSDSPNGESGAEAPDATSEDPHAKRKRSSDPRGTRLPDTWRCTPELQEIARGFGLTDGEIANAAAEFFDYWRALPGARGRKLDWDATWRNRVRDVAPRIIKSRAMHSGSSHGGRVSGAQTIADAGRALIAKREAARTQGRAIGGGGGQSGAPDDGADPRLDGPLRLRGQGSSGDGDCLGGLDGRDGAVSVLRGAGGLQHMDGREEPAQVPDAGGYRGLGEELQPLVSRAVADDGLEIPAVVLRRA